MQIPAPPLPPPLPPPLLPRILAAAAATAAAGAAAAAAHAAAVIARFLTSSPPPPPPVLPRLAGHLQLDLIEAGGLTTHPIATCLASVKVNLGSDCAVSLTPLSSGGSYVPGIWASTSEYFTYSKLRECPVTTGAEIAGADTAAGRVAAIRTAFANFVYGADRPAAGLTIDFTSFGVSAAGVVTVSIGSSPLTYAITKVGPQQDCRSSRCRVLSPLPQAASSWALFAQLQQPPPTLCFSAAPACCSPPSMPLRWMPELW
jgi:hypothetical protein